MITTFYKIPKILLEDERFCDVSLEAKILYGVLLSRFELSTKNGWKDESGRIYIVFTVDEAADVLGISKSKCLRLFKEIDTENGCGLIEKKRVGLTKPSLIYVNEEIAYFDEENCKEESSSEVSNKDFLKYQNDTSRSVKMRLQEVSDKDSIYKDNRYKDNRYISEEEGARAETEKSLEEKIKEQIDFDVLIPGNGKERLLSIVDVMSDVMRAKKDYFVIENEKIPNERVKKRFSSLNGSHVEYVLDTLKERKRPVHHIKNYLLSSLYNSPTTMNLYYEMAVRRDLTSA